MMNVFHAMLLLCQKKFKPTVSVHTTITKIGYTSININTSTLVLCDREGKKSSATVEMFRILD